MAAYDTFSKRISDFGNRIKKGQENVTGTMKLSSNLRDTESQLSSKYEKLGRFYYENKIQHKDNQNSIDSLCNEITLLEEERTELNKEINILKGFRICPNCGSAVAKGSAYCNNCGMKMPEEIQQIEHSGRRCANCGAPLEEGQLFCTECGAKVEQKKAEQVCPYCGAKMKEGQKFCINCGMDLTKADEQQASNDRGDNQTDTQAEAQGGRVCPNCGTPLEEGQKFCINCGMDLTKADEQQASDDRGDNQTDTQAEAQGGRACPNCGAPLEEGQKFCINCGMDLTKADEQQASDDRGDNQTDTQAEAQGGRVCPNCGAPLEEGQLFCTECGTTLSVEKFFKSLNNTYKEENNPEGSITHMNMDEEESSGVTDEEKFTEEGIATEGGTEKEVESEDLSGIDNTEEIIEREKTVPDEEENLPIICPKCGNLIKPRQRFCTYCGTPVDIKKANDGDDQ